MHGIPIDIVGKQLFFSYDLLDNVEMFNTY